MISDSLASHKFPSLRQLRIRLVIEFLAASVCLVAFVLVTRSTVEESHVERLSPSDLPALIGCGLAAIVATLRLALDFVRYHTAHWREHH